MSIAVFLSTVTDEFRPYRDQLRGDLTRHNVAVKVQEDFKGLGADTLAKLDTYIAHCDAVVHLVGDMTGSAPSDAEQQAWLAAHQDAATRLPPLAEALRQGAAISYTQWEAWLALYHGKLLLTAKAEPQAPRDPRHKPTDESRAAQAAHLGRLEAVKRYPDCTFANDAELAKHIAYTAILDLLVRDYARQLAEERDVAQGFIGEMAGRVSADTTLDLDGKKHAVRTAIDIYVDEIAGARTQTNLSEAIDRALATAKRLTDEGKSRAARAALRKTAEGLRRDEADRRAAFQAGITTLYGRERDIALAAYDGEAAAEAVVTMAETLHGDRRDARRALLIAEGDALEEFGYRRGSNTHLFAAIAVRQASLAIAAGPDLRATDSLRLGNALWRLGERESGTHRLELAAEAYRAALSERPRDCDPKGWASAQVGIGRVLSRLGERENGTERLKLAVAAYSAALEEHTRDRVPLDWATTQNNLGVALQRIGERENGTERLEQAVTAYRAALQERTRDLVPLDWAMTSNNLGNALLILGERTENVKQLEHSVAAYRAALEERTRDRVPLDWAMTQNNLGLALQTLAARETGTERLNQAVDAHQAALEERTRERVPLDWAYSRHALALALAILAERTHDRAQMTAAITALHDAAEVYRQGNVSRWLPEAERRIGELETTLIDMRT